MNVASGVQTVNDILNQENQWDWAKIHTLFNKEIARAIAKVHTRRDNIDDKIIGKPDPEGMFTIKSSAYDIAQFIFPDVMNTQPMDGEKVFLKKLWKLFIPHRFQLFNWKVLKNLLPTAEVLHHRGILDNLLCHYCAQEIEDCYHVMFGCEWARHKWRLSEFPFNWEGTNNSVWDCFQIIEKSDKEIKGDRNQVWLYASFMMYALWFARNSARLKHSQISLMGVLAFVRNVKQKWVCAEDYAGVKFGDDDLYRSDQSLEFYLQSLVIFSQDKQNWYLNRPPPGWAVLLTDAAMSPDDGTAAFGAVLVDGNGSIIGTKARFYDQVIQYGAEEAELLAVEHGIEWADTLSLRSLIVFSNCSNVINGPLATSTDHAPNCS